MLPSASSSGQWKGDVQLQGYGERVGVPESAGVGGLRIYELNGEPKDLVGWHKCFDRTAAQNPDLEPVHLYGLWAPNRASSDKKWEDSIRDCVKHLPEYACKPTRCRLWQRRFGS